MSSCTDEKKTHGPLIWHGHQYDPKTGECSEDLECVVCGETYWTVWSKCSGDGDDEKCKAALKEIQDYERGLPKVDDDGNLVT